jgi:hypothetical protein
LVDRDLRRGRDERALHEFAARARNSSGREQIDRDALTALQALTEAGVDVLLLKGAALAGNLYRHKEARGYADADLLVRPSAVAWAGQILAGLGYRSVDEVRGVEDVAGSIHAETWSRRTPERGLMAIDLHRRLAGCAGPEDSAFDVLFARREPVVLAGRMVHGLDQTAMALHLALHIAQHGPGDVKAAADLERGLERWRVETWREAAALASELDAVESFAAGLALTSSGARMLAQLELEPSGARLWAIQNRASRPRGTFHLQAFTEAAGASVKLSLIRRALLPPAAWIRWEYSWAGRGGLRLAIAYALHIARAPSWALRAWRYARRARMAGRG